MPGASKEICLENYLSVFPNTQTFLIQDNCDDIVKNKISKIIQNYPNVVTEITELGNSGSFKYILNKAIQHDPNELIYFLEDDYLHHPLAEKVLPQGLTLGEYTTLYDHPDKYCSEYNYGETSKVMRSKNHHWKHSISTTMTFATKVSTLIEDKNIWLKHSEGVHPDDHSAFCEIKKKLSVAIPSLAFHNDLACYTFFPPNKQPDIDQWVLDYLSKTLVQKIYKCHNGDMEDMMHELLRNNSSSYIVKIICLEQILQIKKTG